MIEDDADENGLFGLGVRGWGRFEVGVRVRC